MTRTAIFSIVILVILGLAAGGNRIVGGILDAKLAGVHSTMMETSNDGE